MASRTNFPAAAFLILAVIATWAAGKASATTYVVGGSNGWTVPSGGAATYAAFAAQHTFQVGDLLAFNFQTGSSDLAIVSKQNYDGCIATGPISLVTSGPATVNLTSIGEAYFICTLNGRCSQGQKLAVNVTQASTASPVPTTSPPSPAPQTSSAPPPSMSPPPMSPTPAPSMAPTMPPPSSSPSPGPSMAPGSSPGTLSPGSSPAPGPGGAPGDMTPPPPSSAAPAAPSATAALLLIASIAVANFF